ncbi:hypothetical protein THAOC_36896 [Thalassiosira oceanica]|uniref:Uncharacterized protein n=1 Tax=Thalassiosira oceanica TaxID=159749 RepID=K0R135_THAOC|nr:hypothetical protein THAOC_36896 [Thalassiosira oceanica]|eukprot:EJK44554.1 hypothetical protein THAOC_36896 [Thalassiosira oceanica]
MTTALTTYYSSDAASGIENPNSVYYAWFKHDDPYTGKPGRVHYFYYDSTKENMPTPPRSWRDVADPYAKSVQMVERRVQVVRNSNNAKEAEFSKRARDYMLAYRAFETDEMKGGMKDSGKPLDITHHMIEKMKKVVSSHRAALIIKEESFDLVRFVVKPESKSLPVKREESSGETSRKSSRKRTKTSRG